MSEHMTPARRRAIRKRRAERKAQSGWQWNPPVNEVSVKKNEIDEVLVSDCLAHLERMSDQSMFVCLTSRDGSEIVIWLNAFAGKLTTSFERRPKP